MRCKDEGQPRFGREDSAKRGRIDLSGKKAEGVVRLKEFLPKLDEVNL
jgi:hypothetical protein